MNKKDEGLLITDLSRILCVVLLISKSQIPNIPTSIIGEESTYDSV